MPSPFPGMDPFIESQEWEDFHHATIEMIRGQIIAAAGERYAVHVERRIYIETVEPDVNPRRSSVVIPDVAILGDQSSPGTTAGLSNTAIAAAVECLIPIPEEKRESFLVLRDVETRQIVSVIELLSPSNKRLGSRGRRKYLVKRRLVIDSEAHLVEIDLLRGGARMPFEAGKPLSGEYLCLVSRANRRPRAELYAWALRQKLPKIPIPLKSTDGDVSLDLQAVFDATYDHVHYDRMLNYSAPLVPPADAETQKWIDHVLGDRPSSSSHQ